MVDDIFGILDLNNIGFRGIDSTVGYKLEGKIFIVI